MPIIGWVVLAWFGGMIVADVVPAKFPIRKSGDMIYQIKEANGQKFIEHYRAYGQSSCRPQCYMSGTFFNGVVRPMVPYPFRRGKFYECAKEGEIDDCTGEIYHDGHWMAGLYPIRERE